MRTATRTPATAGAAQPPCLAWIQGGEFTMGSDTFYPEERPAHRVAVDTFWMETRPVTVADFRRFVTATSYRTVAEQPLSAADYADADPDTLVPDSLVFRRAAGPVDLQNFRQEWEFAEFPWQNLLLDGYEGTSPGSAFPVNPAARQAEATETSTGYIGFRCVIRSGPLLAGPGLRPACHHSTSVQISGRGPSPASTAANRRAASLRWPTASSRRPAACNRSAMLVCSAASRCWSPSSLPRFSASCAAASASSARPASASNRPRLFSAATAVPRSGSSRA